MHPFDPERFKLPAGAVGEPKPRKHPPRHRKGEQFLWGPIPWLWLATAGKLPGRALHVAIALWQLAGMKKNRTVKWERGAGECLGLNRWAVHRGLAALERARLITVDRHNGRCPVVTILEPKP